MYYESSEYKDFKTQQFYNFLIEFDVLKNDDNDVERLLKFEDLFESEAKEFKIDARYALGGVLLAFIIPLWSQIIETLFESEQIGFEKALFMSMTLLTLISSIIISGYFFLKIFHDEMNKRSSKYSQIAKLLKSVRLSRELKRIDKKSTK